MELTLQELDTQETIDGGFGESCFSSADFWLNILPIVDLKRWNSYYYQFSRGKKFRKKFQCCVRASLYRLDQLPVTPMLCG